MGDVRGSLLITTEGLETANIPVLKRQDAVRSFYEMKTEAERCNDRFYALMSVYSHHFSYGAFYPHFCNLSWSEFSACPSLQGIDERVFELMQSFCRNPGIASLDNENSFKMKDEPLAYTGYSNPMRHPSFVSRITEWEEWHSQWYTSHQEQIDWTRAKNDWLPRPDKVLAILRKELYTQLEAEVAEHICSNMPDCEIVTEFYDRVMKHQGPLIHAYTDIISNKICKSNYYREEVELSNLEQQHAGGSFRRIYSIVNCNGHRRFISVDYAHGMFELLNEKGNHLGEYRFDGTLNKSADESHSLKCMDEWRRLTGR